MQPKTSFLSQLSAEKLKGQRVFLRLDLNVPLHEGQITDTARIEATLPTIKYLLDKKARLVVTSHLGRREQHLSFEPVAQKLGSLLKCEVLFVDEVAGDATKYLLKDLKPHQIIVLENLRLDERETQNHPDLAKLWAAYTDIYINDAFGTCHRPHTSLVALPQLVPCRVAGFLVEHELKMLNQVLNATAKPFVCVLGGAKVSDKIGVIENLMDRVDEFVIGGAMAYTFLAASKVAVGSSRIEAAGLQFAKHLIDRIQVRGKKLWLPVDHMVVHKEAYLITKKPSIEADFMGVDIGPRTAAIFAERIQQAQLVFLNGPMGVFEQGLVQGSERVLQAAAEVHRQGGVSVLGGGDSLALARKLNMVDKLSFVSTGGGASLEYLQHGHLPAIKALSC